MSKSIKMPKTVNMAAQCPFCGKQFEYSMYPEIHIPGDSRLKKKVMDKTLFFPKCSFCKEQFKLKANCMYRNDNQRVWFIVMDSTDHIIEHMMKSGDIHFNDIRTDDDIMGFLKGRYIRRVVYDVDAFREKILLSDNNYDDRIMELIKLSLSGLIAKENQMPVYRIFLEETSGNELVFTAILGNHAFLST